MPCLSARSGGTVPPLPMSRAEMNAYGWDALDILLVSGDAYVDHPSFGAALLGRWLLAAGFRVGIAAQPRWGDPTHSMADISSMGRPRLFAGVTAGAIDSMLAHYTAFRKKRSDDAYTPGGKAGARPNRACIVYTGMVRQVFPGLPVVLGGIEASLRRISHYDFWSDSLRRPLLQDSKADLLAYGMGERSLLAMAHTARRLLEESGERGEDGSALSRMAFAAACRDIPGLAFIDSASAAREWVQGRESAPLLLPSHEEILREPALLMRATLALEGHVHGGGVPEQSGKGVYCLQESGGRAVVLTPPSPPLDEAEMDALYSLPFTRLPHPGYTRPVPAWETVRAGISTHRGCGGGCSFCSLALHQGRRIASRSRESIMREASVIAAGPRSGGNDRTEIPPRWAASISDVGGPSANMWQAECAIPGGKACGRDSCLHPAICPFFRVDQSEGVRLLRDIAALPGVRHVRIASGVRFDLALRNADALSAYTAEFTGGQLKVAPEHSEAEVLRLMRKPDMRVFERFLAEFHRHCEAAGKEQYVVPYLMSAFPGCTEKHMRSLAAWLRRKHWRPRQVQCFIPTPGTVATAMFYAGISPDGGPLYVARSDKERLRQHHLLLSGEESGRNQGLARRRSIAP